ncbi:MAG: SAM-dependent methyltransferase [Firmicutes bacterium]|nr:SAM-dependent methyltransferase [Bacillota bacterium]
MIKDDVIPRIAREDLIRLTFSSPRNEEAVSKEKQVRKIVLRPVMIRQKKMLQAESFTEKQAFQKNISFEELARFTEEQMDRFAEINAQLPESHVLVRISKKGKIFFQEKKEENQAPKTVSVQNREKKYLLRPEEMSAPLIDLGVITKDGKIVRSKYDKFRQINRFVEMIDDGIEADVTSLNIIDFGCGKSYLTFVLYEYLTKVRSIQVQMVGLDLKEDVIRKCNEIAVSYGYSGLHFEVGDIAGFHPPFKVDLVISLHACDTATDLALANAVKWDTERINSVPCCQHELNAQMKTGSFGSLSQYGLFKERFAALLTDAIRADLLRASGYTVDVLEFVDLAHSPKNVLLRARKIRSRNTGKMAAGKALLRVKDAMETYQVDPMLYELLFGSGKEEGQHE